MDTFRAHPLLLVLPSLLLFGCFGNAMCGLEEGGLEGAPQLGLEERKLLSVPAGTRGCEKRVDFLLSP